MLIGFLIFWCRTEIENIIIWQNTKIGILELGVRALRCESGCSVDRDKPLTRFLILGRLVWGVV